MTHTGAARQVPGESETPTLSALPTVSTVTLREALALVRTWLSRFVVVLNESDLDLLTLWVGHTHAIDRLHTTPRLSITSMMPSAGKTTLIEHLQRLCLRGTQFGAVTTSAMLTRLIATEPRTLLIDEVDRNLRPDRPGVEDLLAVLNTGYKRGATRPVNVPDAKHGWRVEMLPTFSPVAWAGISPHLPDDTLSRTVRVVLLPDAEGLAEDTDWEEIEGEALDVAESLKEAVAGADLPKPEMPEFVLGRAKERWRPLWRIAHAAGGDWPDRCLHLMKEEHDNAALDKEDGTVAMRPEMKLILHIAEEWPPGTSHLTTEALCRSLATRHPQDWGASDQFPKGLTVQRVGRYLRNFNLRTERDASGARIGYSREKVARLCRRLGFPEPGKVTVETVEVAETDDSGPPRQGREVTLLDGLQTSDAISEDDVCDFPGCRDVRMFGGVSCAGHLGSRRPRAEPEPRQFIVQGAGGYGTCTSCDRPTPAAALTSNGGRCDQCDYGCGLHGDW